MNILQNIQPPNAFGSHKHETKKNTEWYGMIWFNSLTLTVSLLLKKFNIRPVVYSWYLKTVMWTHWVIYILSLNKIVAMLRMVPYDTCGREHAKLNIKTGFKKRWLKYEVGCFFLL